MDSFDIVAHNRRAWDLNVDQGNRWTRTVDSATIERAKRGEVNVVLTPTKAVPLDWFGPLSGMDLLCLAAAGGQQAPVFAAAGARVTVFDNSPKQLNQDQVVAKRERLEISLVEGDMADLSKFGDGSFDLVFHPCSNTFAPDVIPVWRECYRVLRSGGVLMSGFTNPCRYIFDDERKENGNLEVRYAIPYSDLEHLDEPHIQRDVQIGNPLEFGHTLEDQIGGQLKAGFLLTAFYEDAYPASDNDPLSKYLNTFAATRAIKT